MLLYLMERLQRRIAKTFSESLTQYGPAFVRLADHQNPKVRSASCHLNAWRSKSVDAHSLLGQAA